MKNTINTILKVDKKITSRRIWVIGSQLFNRFSIPAFNLITSLIVVNLFSRELWGEYVYLSLMAAVLTVVIAWGSQEYLLKQFSTKPSQIFETWVANVVIRSLLYVAITFPLMFLLPLRPEVSVIFPVFVLSIAAYKSFDVLITYFRRFMFAFVVETSAFVFTIALILLSPGLDIAHLILIFTAANILKSFLLMWAFVSRKRLHISINFRSLRESFPFFLPSVIGLIQSRIDMYIVAALLSREVLASYQIYFSLLTLVHQVGLMFISPYIKNIYRLSALKINILAWRFFLYGTVASALAIPAIFLVQRYLYHTHLGLPDYVLGFLILLPLFFYSIKTYEWFRDGKQYQVALVNAIMAVVATILGLILIPRYGITGGLCASAFSQWIAFFIFVVKKRL